MKWQGWGQLLLSRLFFIFLCSLPSLDFVLVRLHYSPCGCSSLRVRDYLFVESRV
uniref:Uncharacterized protein n=1 Tax=Rhizophora mucronata TaxID=61149 RepID=A0A2P2QCG5_RHIMU